MVPPPVCRSGKHRVQKRPLSSGLRLPKLERPHLPRTRMSRVRALELAREAFDGGSFQATLAARVACLTESQVAARAPVLLDYLQRELAPGLGEMGFTCRLLDNP